MRVKHIAMKSKFVILNFVIALGLLLGVCLLWQMYAQCASPKSQARNALKRLDQALVSQDPRGLLETVCLPSAIRDRTQAEQNEFVRKTLLDEVSSEGIRVLAAEGAFGPLAQVFPAEAVRWASQAGVSVSNCVAFRLEKNGVVAEVAIATNGVARVIRCNNVKQMAL